MKLYAINKTLSNLLFKNGYLEISRGGFAAIAREDAASAEFVSAEGRGWIEISETAPSKVSAPAVEAVVIENPNKGMTADELKTELKKEAPKSGVTVEALGQGAPAGANAEAEARSEAIGQDTVVEVTPGAEGEAPAEGDAKKSGKKGK